jgi:molybdate transport system substrate-binding protein
MKKLSIFLLFALLSISMQAQTVKIAAAANLRFVLEEIKDSYSKSNPHSDIALNFGSTGALCQQIVNGADLNLFMAADNEVPVKLKNQGLVSGEVKTYAFGKLVLWSNTIDVSKGLEVLTDPSVKRIAIAKPDLAPYGDRAIECLKSMGMYEKLKDKIVYADNISQAAQFAQTGNAEVGFLAYSLTLTPEMKGSSFLIDPKSYKPVAQAMAVVKGWKACPEAVKFMKYVLSPECKPIFEKFGYIVP